MKEKDRTELKALLHLAGIVLVRAVLPFAAAIVVAVHFIPGPPTPGDPVELARMHVEIGSPASAVRVLEAEVAQDSANLELHRRLIWAHFRQPAHQGRSHHRDDDARRAEYEELARNTDAGTRDIGIYGLGYFHFYDRDPAEAMEAWSAISDDSLPGLALGRGRALATLGQHAEAVASLEAAVGIEEGDSLSFAYRLLADSHRALGNWDSVADLAAAHTADMSPSVIGSLMLHDGDFDGYVAHFAKYYTADVWWPYAALVLAGALMWFLVIRRWDHYEKEPLGWSIATVVAGGVGGHLVFMMHDMLGLVVDVRPRGSWLADIYFFVVWVGVPEELIKLAPVAFVARWSKEIDEPVDWLIYGMLSALGFAAWENIHYAAGVGPSTIIARTFASMPLHMALTGTIALAIPEARIRNWRVTLTLLGAFFAVATFHGVFNVLVTRNSGIWGMLGFYGFLYLAMFLFMPGLAHTVARSPFRAPAAGGRVSTAGLLAYSAIWMTCVLIVAEAFRVPEGHRGGAYAKNALDLMSLIFPILVFQGFAIPEAWRPDWFVLKKPSANSE